tara:strand:- start:1137 stop:1268 length:132 start_codon:yes stop_codon:yes gene_type:complete
MIQKLLIYLAAFTVGLNFPIIAIFASSFYIGALIAKTKQTATQ